MYEEGAPVDEVVEGIRRVLIARHGSEDFTITTQQEMLDVLGSVLNVITFAVGALGGISMLVGGVGIFTIMTIAVRERTAEIGLLQAVGAHRRQIRNMFLGESTDSGGHRRLVGHCAWLRDHRPAEPAGAGAAGQSLLALHAGRRAGRHADRPHCGCTAGLAGRAARSGRVAAGGIAATGLSPGE